jgi:Cdc6-like AAA superfamily ATPase
MDLKKIDMDTNWSDRLFTPLDAEVEVQSGFRRFKKVTDLLSAIRSDRISKVFLVLGDPGSGKSVSLRKLCGELLQESTQTGKAAIYINLREWDSKKNWTEETPPSVNDLYDFVVQNLKSRGTRDTSDFIDKFFHKLFESGRLFIILDSFDEIPSVLDVSEDS